MLFKLTIHNGLPSFDAKLKLIRSFQTITDESFFYKLQYFCIKAHIKNLRLKFVDEVDLFCRFEMAIVFMAMFLMFSNKNRVNLLSNFKMRTYSYKCNTMVEYEFKYDVFRCLQMAASYF